MQRIAHRGARREYPENTLPAFARALELEADGIELDVHRTSDGLIVVHHDPVLRDGREITNLAAAELAAYELEAGIGIPALADVLELVGSRATVYVEIKGRGIAADVAAVVRDARASCAIHSFDHAQILELVRLAPELPRGLLLESLPAEPLGDLLARHEARDLWPHHPLVTSELIEEVHEVGCAVITWTVNSAADAERLADLGVDGLCGDDVRVFDSI